MSDSPRVLRNHIGGQFVDATTDARSDVVNPATGKVVASAAVSGQEDVDRAYAAASSAFGEWGRTTPRERQEALLKFAAAVEARADDFVRLEGENTGKPNALTASEEVPPMLDQIRFFAGAARVLEGRSTGEYMRGHTSWIRREPIGVIGQVTPPVGVLCFVAMAITREKLGPLFRELWPCLIALIVALAIITYVPALSLWLPHVAGF